MNKPYRALLVIVLSVLAVAIALTGSVWASSNQTGASVNSASGQSTVNLRPPLPGSVQTPCDFPGVVEGATSKSLCGEAILTGMSGDTKVEWSLDPRPDGFISKIVVLFFSKGGATLCFAAPKGTEKIYVNNNGTWKSLGGIYSSGEVCIDLTDSGQYVLGN